MNDEQKELTQLSDELSAFRRRVAEMARFAIELKRKDEKYQMLIHMIESSDDAIVTVTLDGIITSWNGGAEAIYGYKPSEIIGQSVTLLIPPEQQNELLQFLRKIEAGERINHYDAALLRKDGSGIHVSLSLSPIRDSGSRIIGASTIARDITEKKDLESRLRRNELQYRNLFQNNHATLLVIDPENGRILDANPAACRYYGYSIDEITAMKITDINMLSPDQVFEEMARAKKEQRHQFFFRHRLKNGDVRPVEVYSGPVEIGERQLLYSIIHDISERVKAQEEREKLIVELKDALSEIKTLSGMLPICASCKKIRNDDGYWEQLEVFIRDHSDAEFSHSICPDCVKKLYPDLK